MKLETFLTFVTASLFVIGGVIWFGRPTAAPSANPPQAESEHLVEIDPNAPPPKAVVDGKEYDFGVMEAGEVRSHKFVVRNEGEGPLVLKQGETTCKCTISKMEGENLPPGESTEIELEWRPQGVQDLFEQRAEIHTNDPETPVITLTVRGRVDQILRINPEESWSLGVLSEEEPAEVTGTLVSSVLEDFEIAAVETAQDWVDAEAVPITDADRLESLGAKCGYELKVKVTPTMSIGPFRETVTIRTVARDEETKFELYLTGKRSGPVRIVALPGVKWHPEADVIEFGTFEAAEGKSGRLSLFISGLKDDQEFEFTDVQVDPEHLQVRLEPDQSLGLSGRRRYFLEVEIPAGHPPVTRTRERKAKITAKTNHPAVESLEFRVVYVAR